MCIAGYCLNCSFNTSTREINNNSQTVYFVNNMKVLTITIIVFIGVPVPVSCAEGRCKNGGNCANDEFGAFNCTCLEGFSGIYCEIEPGMVVQPSQTVFLNCLIATTLICPTDLPRIEIAEKINTKMCTCDKRPV